MLNNCLKWIWTSWFIKYCKSAIDPVLKDGVSVRNQPRSRIRVVRRRSRMGCCMESAHNSDFLCVFSTPADAYKQVWLIFCSFKHKMWEFYPIYSHSGAKKVNFTQFLVTSLVLKAPFFQASRFSCISIGISCQTKVFANIRRLLMVLKLALYGKISFFFRATDFWKSILLLAFSATGMQTLKCV